MSGCRICSSGQAEEINEQLLRRVPMRALAAKYGFSRAGLGRHSRKCLPKAMAESQHPAVDQELRAEAKRLKDAVARGFDVHFVVRYTRSPRKDPPRLTDAELVEELEELVRSTQNNLVMLAAARLVLVLKGMAVPPELDRLEERAMAEAGDRT